MKTKNVCFVWWLAVAVGLGFAGRSNAQDFFEEPAPPVHQQGVLKNVAAAGDARIAVAGGFDFNDGTLQGWHTSGPYDEDGDGPFASHFSAGWADAVNHPTASLSEAIGNHRGSYKICNTPGHGITNPGATYWIMYWNSPDLSTVTNWQSANGYTIQLLNAMDLIGALLGEHLTLYVNLRVTVYDHDLARERYFRAFPTDRAIETWNASPQWIGLSYDWTAVMSAIPHHTIREVYVSVRGAMADHSEGAIYLDEVQPILTSGSSPAISLSTTSLDFGIDENDLTIEISNSGGGSLTWSAAENPDVPWITSISPSSGTGAGVVTVTVDRTLLTEEEGTAEIRLTSNGGDKTIAVSVRKSLDTKWVHADIEAKLTPGDGAEADNFGQYVDVDGDYVIVGASGDNNAAGTNAGAAYIYHWDGAHWIEQQKLVALDGAEEDYFGYSVGISGDYAIVGSCWDDDAADKSGSAYIFKRSGTTWTQEAKLVATDAGLDNRFGISVAIDGEYALVGAFFDDDFRTRSGSAYIFKRSGSTWTQQARLLATDGMENDWFGVSVSLDGEHAAVGARYHDMASVVDAGAVYVFQRDGSTWNQQQKITAGDATAGDLFHECSIQGDWLAVGAYRSDSKAKDAGAVYLFHREGSSWIERQKLTAEDGAEGDWFAAHTALNGDCLVVGAYLDDDNGKDSGSLYVFRLDGTGWRQETKIIPSDGAEGDWFGLPVNMAGSWLVTGARQHDLNGSNAGAIYIFKYEDKNRWIREDIESKILATDASEKDLFGSFVDKDGDYIIVGAPYEDNAAGADAGAAYVYHWDGMNWIEQQKLVALDGAVEDYFGYSVGISGDYAVIGACWDDDAADKSGSAYIFKRTGSHWAQQAKLTANDAGADNRFGISATIDGEYVLVGAFFDDDFGTRSGSAYIFKRNGTTWTQQARLLASDGAANDWFGVSLALDGEYAAVGSRYHDQGAVSDAGAVYIYKRSGTIWSEQQKLVAGDGAAADLFHECSIAGPWLAIGAYQSDSKAKNAGAVYLFHRDGEVWSERQKILADDGAEGDLFGARTSLDENGLIVGAYLDDDNGKDSGSLYVFRYDGSQWLQETKIIAGDGATEDWFGLPVVHDAGWIVAGARQNDEKGANSGAIYIYRYLNPTTVIEEKERCLPSSCRLQQNYPNPFNPQTTIRYQLSDPAEAILTIYNGRGRTVAVLDQGRQAQGEHTVVWRGLDDRGQPVSSGLYLYRLEVRPTATDDPLFMDMKKMIFLK